MYNFKIISFLNYIWANYVFCLFNLPTPYHDQTRVLAFDEISFPKEFNVRSIIMKITRFALIIIIGFDLNVIEVGNIVVVMIHSKLFMKATEQDEDQSRI